ncbi:hypothetical protein MAR_038015 [Mya arenaria]|uniref:Uncharacterized protein n=1 Tax=Mya arenaria TaxID=6604 RepID=A0ABY7FU11_MYAAR|nr:hypothetical protein MAR_038015 [Mya arenaria]
MASGRAIRSNSKTTGLNAGVESFQSTDKLIPTYDYVEHYLHTIIEIRARIKDKPVINEGCTRSKDERMNELYNSIDWFVDKIIENNQTMS